MYQIDGTAVADMLRKRIEKWTGKDYENL